MRFFWFSILFVIILSCQTSTEDFISVDVKQEIENLKTIQEKNSYLEELFHLDQRVRVNEKFAHQMDSVDKINYARIDYYLETFGHPHKDSVSSLAVLTPWVVIHHTGDNTKRKKHFDVLARAYQEDQIDVDKFDLYLRRTFSYEFGYIPTWEGSYNPDDKIEWMMAELGLSYPKHID